MQGLQKDACGVNTPERSSPQKTHEGTASADEQSAGSSMASRMIEFELKAQGLCGCGIVNLSTEAGELQCLDRRLGRLRGDAVFDSPLCLPPRLW
jgi:hypothetical protein